MSLNLQKNREQILQSYKNVLDEHNLTDWALYGYEGQTNDLKVVATGDGGITELKDDLNEGKIQYAFVRVTDINTGLNKFILINWQGEGAQTLRKGTCAKHIYDVSMLLKGAHLTINASNEDDVDEERILKRVASVTPKYNFKEQKIVTIEEKREPIGTNYQKKVISKEINATERDSFWKKEEEEENKRQAEEADRKRMETAKTEQERIKREESASKADTGVRRDITTADMMRQARSTEAKQLIGNRVNTAKAMFSQNTEYKPQKSPTPVKPARSSIAKKVEALNNGSNGGHEDSVASRPEMVVMPTIPEPKSPVVREEPAQVWAEPKVEEQQVNNIPIVENAQPTVKQFSNEPIDDDEQFSTIKRSPHTKSITENQVEAIVQQPAVVVQQPAVAQVTTNEIETNEIGELTEDLQMFTGLKARALYDYQAADETEITFDPGDLITHIDQIDEGWWQGLGPDGKTYGLFPANYVDIIP